MLNCLDFLEHETFAELDISPFSMFSMLVTANHLQIPRLETELTDYIANHFSAENIVAAMNIAEQTKISRFIDKAYM